MIKEKELQKAVVSNKLITHKATDLTIMSYDKNVHKLIIPTDLTQAEISDIIVLITFRYHKNIIQISGELVEDKIEIILPNEIRSLSGEFYIEIDINLTDNRQITFARYRANIVKSDIDSVDLDDAQEFYFELFDDFVQKVTDKSEVAVAEIDAHKQAVSDKADTAIAVIDNAQAEFDDLYADKSQMMDTLKVEKSNEMDQLYDDKNQALTGLESDFADKAENLETTYAPRLTSAEQDITTNHQEVSAQLHQTEQELSSQLAEKAEQFGSPGKKYKVVACVVRNVGGVWDFIEDSKHSKVGCSSIEVVGSTVVIHFDFVASKVLSFVATPDEQYVKNGINFGSSVGADKAIISISQVPQNIGGYVSYNGTDWVLSNHSGDVSIGDFIGGILNINHEDVGSEIMGSLTGRDGCCIPQWGSVGRTLSQVRFYDFNGSAVTTPNTNMKFSFTRNKKQATLTPAQAEYSSSNIWCYGIFEVD